MPGVSEPASAARDAELAAWAARLGITRTMAGWLWSQGHRDAGATQAFLDKKLRDLTPPDGMADRDAAARRLAAALRRRERVVVFGDYDCDGITSTAILTEVLRALGGVVHPLLASRFDGGYGVSPAAARRIAALEPCLLVTCDCGSSDHDALAELGARGIESIVIDHHLVPERPLPALAFLNPHRPECGFPYKGLASCGLVFSIAAGLRRELGVGLDLKPWLDLVAIGTIADVAPLDGDNRALVRAGLLALQRPERPGLRALLDLCKLGPEAPLTGRDIAFRIAPHLNAPGRMQAPDLALELLLAQAPEEAARLAEALGRLSTERREQQDAMFEEAQREIDTAGSPGDPAVVVGRAGWNAGIVGIVAGKLAERFHKPAVVIGFDGEVGRGSVRGPAGARLYEALASCRDCLVRFGGHQAAAGLEIERARLSEFRTRFLEAISSATPSDDTRGADSDVVALFQGERPGDVLRDLDRLEPCGKDNPRPRLRLTGTVLRAREVKGSHLKLDFAFGRGELIGGFAVGQGSRAAAVVGPATLIGDLRHTSFPGSGGVELFVERIESA